MFSILSEFSACLCLTRCFSGNFFYRLINGYTLANYDGCYPKHMRMEYVVLYRIASIAVSATDPDHFDTDPGPTFYFDTEPDPTFHFDTDPDPYCFKEVMYIKSTFQFLYILT